MADLGILNSEPTTMRAVYYSRHADQLTVGWLPRPPSPGPGQLFLRVRAAGLNPVDYKTAAGAHALLFHFAWPRVVGFDFSGEVVAVGEGGTDLAIGDAVFGQIRGLPQLHKGTLADYVLVSCGWWFLHHSIAQASQRLQDPAGEGQRPGYLSHGMPRVLCIRTVEASNKHASSTECLERLPTPRVNRSG